VHCDCVGPVDSRRSKGLRQLSSASWACGRVPGSPEVIPGQKSGSGIAAMLVGVLAGESPASGTCPVTVVVISGGGKGDQTVGSPEVKVPVGWVKKTWSAPTGGRANRQVVAQANRSQAPKWDSPRESEGGGSGKCRDHSQRSKASVIGEGTGCKQPKSFPGSLRTTCR